MNADHLVMLMTVLAGLHLLGQGTASASLTWVAAG